MLDTLRAVMKGYTPEGSVGVMPLIGWSLRLPIFSVPVTLWTSSLLKPPMSADTYTRTMVSLLAMVEREFAATPCRQKVWMPWVISMPSTFKLGVLATAKAMVAVAGGWPTVHGLLAVSLQSSRVTTL